MISSQIFGEMKQKLVSRSGGNECSYCVGKLIIKTCRYHIFPVIVGVFQIVICSMTACLLGVAWGFQGGVEMCSRETFFKTVCSSH